MSGQNLSYEGKICSHTREFLRPTIVANVTINSGKMANRQERNGTWKKSGQYEAGCDNCDNWTACFCVLFCYRQGGLNNN